MPPGVLRENALMPHLGWPLRNPRVLVNAGGAPADSLIQCMLKCLPGARVSGDDTLHCAALVGELHAARSRGTPTLPALESRLPNEKGNLSGETTFSVSGGLRE